MSLGPWKAILKAHDTIEKAIEKAFGDAPQRPDLASLRATMQRSLTALQKALRDDWKLPANKIILPLVCLYDEQVLVRLGRIPGGPDTAWDRVQAAREWAPEEDGGDLFFEEIDKLLGGNLRDDEPLWERSLVLEVYCFCLQQGFEGKHAVDMAALRNDEDRVFRGIEKLRGELEKHHALAERPDGAAAPETAVARPFGLPARAVDVLVRHPVALAIAAALLVFSVFFAATRWL